MEPPGNAKGESLRRTQPRQQALGQRWVATEGQGRWEGLCQLCPWFVGMEPETYNLRIGNHEKEMGSEKF